MNERIKELAEQARAEVRADWAKGNKIPYPEAHYAFQRDNDQKFAELIVKECEKSIKSVPTHFEAQDKIIVECLKAISEHFFGVEE